MKTIAYATALLAATTAAQAQPMQPTTNAYEVMTTNSTETVGGVTTNVQTNYVSTTAVVVPMMPNVIGDAPATPAVTDGRMVNIKLPNGNVIQVNDRAENWNKDPRLAGYDRFTFDAESGMLMAGMGEAKYSGNWDENGNRVAKSAMAPKKKAAKKMAAPAEEPAADAPAVEAPAEAPAM